MSSVYVSEPPTKGKVVVSTTMGPLDIELWPKEAPKASRNFVQLCLEGYFDNTVFHRVIKSFLIQGGDPTGSGTGGESIYGGVFADEFHSRLRFSHRGLVACANAGTQHSNGSQFFVTLDRCDWLDRKNTIFGKVTGDSIYNLLRLGELETDKNDRPLVPPKILSVEVLWNPFDDIVPRRVHDVSTKKVDCGNKDQKKPAVKKLSVLSFGDEVEEDEKNLEATTKEKIKSIHDVLDDPRFLKEERKMEDENKAQNSSEIERKKDIQLSVRQTLSSKNIDRDDDPSDDAYDNSDDDEARFDARMRSQILKKRRDMGDINTRKKSVVETSNPKDNGFTSPSNEEDTKEATHVQKLSLKKKSIGSEARADLLVNSDADLQLLGPTERERHILKQRKRRLGGHEEDTLARLEKFKHSFAKKVSAPSSNDSKDDVEDYSGWLTNSLKFTSESSKKDAMARKDDPNEYVVFDPLLEKGKEKFNKMQAKLKRREREWAGRSLT